MSSSFSNQAGQEDVTVPLPAMDGALAAMVNFSSLPTTVSFSIRLNRQNYLVWKEQLESLFAIYGLQAFVEGLVPQPAKYLPGSSTLNPKFVAWTRLNGLFKNRIFASVTEEVSSHLIHKSSVDQIWFALKGAYASSASSRNMELRAQFQTTKKDGRSMPDYLQIMKSIADNLAVVGEPINNRDMILYLLEGLGPEYNPFVMTITRPDNYTVDEVCNLLIQLDRHFAHQAQCHDTTGFQANFASTGKNCGNYGKNSKSGGSGKSPPWNLFQYLQGMPTGHTLISQGSGTRSSFLGAGSQFATSTSGSKKPFSDNNKPQCQICQKTGHLAPNCFTLRNILTSLSGMQVHGGTAMAATSPSFSDISPG